MDEIDYMSPMVLGSFPTGHEGLDKLISGTTRQNPEGSCPGWPAGALTQLIDPEGWFKNLLGQQSVLIVTGNARDLVTAWHQQQQDTILCWVPDFGEDTPKAVRSHMARVIPTLCLVAQNRGDALLVLTPDKGDGALRYSAHLRVEHDGDTLTVVKSKVSNSQAHSMTLEN